MRADWMQLLWAWLPFRFISFLVLPTPKNRCCYPTFLGVAQHIVVTQGTITKTLLYGPSHSSADKLRSIIFFLAAKIKFKVQRMCLCWCLSDCASTSTPKSLLQVSLGIALFPGPKRRRRKGLVSAVCTCT